MHTYLQRFGSISFWRGSTFWKSGSGSRIHLSVIVDPDPRIRIWKNWIRIRVPIFHKEIHVGQIAIHIFVTAKISKRHFSDKLCRVKSKTKCFCYWSTITERWIRDPDPLFPIVDPRIRIHVKMRWGRNAVGKGRVIRQFLPRVQLIQWRRPNISAVVHKTINFPLLLTRDISVLLYMQIERYVAGIRV